MTTKRIPFLQPLMDLCKSAQMPTHQKKCTAALHHALFGGKTKASLPPYLQRLLQCQAVIGIQPVADPSSQSGTEAMSVRALSIITTAINTALHVGHNPTDKAVSSQIAEYLHTVPNFRDTDLLAALLTGDFDLTPKMSRQGPGFHLDDSLQTAEEHAEYRHQLRQWLDAPNTEAMFLALRIAFGVERLRLHDPEDYQWELGLSYLQSIQSMAKHIITRPDTDDDASEPAEPGTDDGDTPATAEQMH